MLPRRGKAGTVRAVPTPGTGQTFAEAALNRSSTTDPLLPCFRRHPEARLVVDGVRVDAPAFTGPTGAVEFIPSRPAPDCAARLIAALDRGSEFCVHGAARSPAPVPSRGAFLQCETSGSTGLAKRIRRSHASWIASFAVDRDLWRIAPGTGIAVIGALNHSLALYGVVSALHLGATAHLVSAPRPDLQLRQLRAASPQLVYATPSQLRLLQAPADRVGGVTGVRHVLVGGGFLDAAALTAMRVAFPGAALHQFYGASETSFVTLADAATPEGSVGRAYPRVRLCVRDSEGRDLPDGETGEIWVQSPYLFDGYALGDSTETRWSEGYLSVGELGWRDGEGHLYLAGRRSRMFTVADRNVFPEAIERFLLGLPGVVQAAVLPEADARRGAIPVCFVVGDAIDGDAILARCRRAFGAEAAPRRIVMLDAWPTLASGKTDLPALARWLKGEG
jgi:long-chain acyl-CoA synthetase